MGGEGEREGREREHAIYSIERQGEREGVLVPLSAC